jgi:hypothetical protein
MILHSHKSIPNVLPIEPLKGSEVEKRFDCLSRPERKRFIDIAEQKFQTKAANEVQELAEIWDEQDPKKAAEARAMYGTIGQTLDSLQDFNIVAKLLDERSLFEGSCVFARRVLRLEQEAGREPDCRLFQAIEGRDRYLKGKISLKELVIRRVEAEKLVRELKSKLYLGYEAARQLYAAEAAVATLGCRCNRYQYVKDNAMAAFLSAGWSSVKYLGDYRKCMWLVEVNETAWQYEWLLKKLRSAT